MSPRVFPCTSLYLSPSGPLRPSTFDHGHVHMHARLRLREPGKRKSADPALELVRKGDILNLNTNVRERISVTYFQNLQIRPPSLLCFILFTDHPVRIEYKMSLLRFKILSHQASVYPSDLFHFSPATPVFCRHSSLHKNTILPH